MSHDLAVVGVGRMPYADALVLQREVAARRISGALCNDLLLLVEHPAVITLGRGFRQEHLTTPREFLDARGVEVFEAERGGDVTFHGPGQIVGYPIYDLTEHTRDLHWFLRQLEAAIIAALRELDVTGERREDYTGVWVADRKIASIGIHVKQWVTWHGFALNVMTDLSYFDLIVPCGIPGVQMTSVMQELGVAAPRGLWGRALDAVVLGFAETFGQRVQMVGVEDVGVR